MNKARKWILCVDDSGDTRELYATVLSDYEVILAGTVAEALRIARCTLLDLYLLDASLPDGTGVELCGRIRKFDMNTPIVFVSGAAEQSDRDAAIVAGAQAYMIKPLSIFDLQVTAESLIRQALSRSLEARCIEMHALREAIAEHCSSLDTTLAAQAMEFDQATQQALRSTGYSAFTEAGGLRSEFERFWQAALQEADGHRASDE